eukprot:764347_1
MTCFTYTKCRNKVIWMIASLTISLYYFGWQYTIGQTHHIKIWHEDSELTTPMIMIQSSTTNNTNDHDTNTTSLTTDLNESEILNWTELILSNLLPFNELQLIRPQKQSCIYNKSKDDLVKQKYLNYFNGYNITSLLPTYCLQQCFIPNVLSYFPMTPDIFDRSRTIVGDVTNLRYVFQNKLLRENKCIKILVFGGSVCKTHGGTAWPHWFIFWLNIYFKKTHCSHQLVNKCWGGHGIRSHFISISHTFSRDSLLMQHSGYDMILIDTFPNDPGPTIYSKEDEKYVEYWCRILLSFKDNPAIIILGSAVDTDAFKPGHGVGEYLWLKYLHYYQIPTVSIVDVELQLMLRRMSFLSLNVSQDIYYKYYTSNKYNHDSLYIDHIHPGIGGYQLITLLLAHFMVQEKEKYLRLPYYLKRDNNLDLLRLFPNNILPKPFILDTAYKESPDYKCKLYPILYLSFSNERFVDYLKRNAIGVRYNENTKHYEPTDALDYYYNATNTMFRDVVSTEKEMYRERILNPINNNGFKVVVEVSGKRKNVIKPGLIGYNANDSITFEISREYKQITIGYLKSYQHNGMAMIWIDDNDCTTGQYTEYMVTVDSLDTNDTTSQIAFVTVNNSFYNQKRTERIFLHIYIMEGNDTRIEYKFKILSVLAC